MNRPVLIGSKLRTYVLTFMTLMMMQVAGTAHADFTPTNAFTDNGDGTVTHQLTGLTWMRCSVGQIPGNYDDYGADAMISAVLPA
jgi:hypothetical protein